MKNRIISGFFLLLMVLSSFSSAFAYTNMEEYYIQVGAFKNEENANREANILELAGYDAVMIRVHSFYKVFLGPYSTEERAREIQKNLITNGGSGFLVLKSEMYNVVEPISSESEETNKNSTEEKTEETAEEATEEVAEEVAEETAEEINEGYKVFIIVLISVLWILIILVVIISRLSQNKKSEII